MDLNNHAHVKNNFLFFSSFWFLNIFVLYNALTFFLGILTLFDWIPIEYFLSRTPEIPRNKHCEKIEYTSGMKSCDSTNFHKLQTSRPIPFKHNINEKIRAMLAHDPRVQFESSYLISSWFDLDFAPKKIQNLNQSKPKKHD